MWEMVGQEGHPPVGGGGGAGGGGLAVLEEHVWGSTVQLRNVMSRRYMYEH